MLPLFSMRALGLPDRSNTMAPPRMKPALAMSLVETITDCACTCEPPANTTPDWLISAMPPLAVMRPAMTEGSGPVTRFSVIEVVAGCRNCTLWSRPTSKLRQSITARSVDWVMVVVAGPWPMVAAPPTTRPPCGAAFAGSAWAAARCWASSSAGATSMLPCSRAIRRCALRSRGHSFMAATPLPHRGA